MFWLRFLCKIMHFGRLGLLFENETACSMHAYHAHMWTVCCHIGFGQMHSGYPSAVAAAAARVSRMPASPATETLWQPPSDLLQPVSLTSCGNGIQDSGRCQPPQQPWQQMHQCQIPVPPVPLHRQSVATLTSSNDLCFWVQCRVPTTGLAATQLITCFDACGHHATSLMTLPCCHIGYKLNATWDYARSHMSGSGGSTTLWTPCQAIYSILSSTLM